MLERVCADLHSEKHLLKDLDGALSRVRKNKTCLYPTCSASPISSHVIARKTLKLIAENGHVLTWLPLRISSWKIAQAIHAGSPLERLYEEPQNVGIGDVNKITSPLFCSSHDNSLFSPLEKGAFSFQAEQVLLFAYRVLSSISFRRHVISAIDDVIEITKKHNYYSALSEPERYARLQRFLADDAIREIYQRYEQIRMARDYSQLGYSIYPVNMPPCIAATYGFVSTYGDEAQGIVNGTQAITAEDFISFTFLPHETSNQSLCVISWLKGSQRAQRFLLLSRINELSQEEQQDVLLSLAFASPIIYISPPWWRSLSEEKRKEFKKTHINANAKYAALV